jgi:hypothetical protein
MVVQVLHDPQQNNCSTVLVDCSDALVSKLAGREWATTKYTYRMLHLNFGKIQKQILHHVSIPKAK